MTPDEDAIVRCTLDYFEGWFDGDPERMRRALHPDLAKRSPAREWLDEIDRPGDDRADGAGAGQRARLPASGASTSASSTFTAHRLRRGRLERLPRVPPPRPHGRRLEDRERPLGVHLAGRAGVRARQRRLAENVAVHLGARDRRRSRRPRGRSPRQRVEREDVSVRLAARGARAGVSRLSPASLAPCRSTPSGCRSPARSVDGWDRVDDPVGEACRRARRDRRRRARARRCPPEASPRRAPGRCSSPSQLKRGSIGSPSATSPATKSKPCAPDTVAGSTSSSPPHAASASTMTASPSSRGTTEA